MGLRFLLMATLGAFALPVLAQSPMPRTELSVGMYRIDAEVAATQEHRMVGLMQRRSLPANGGMIFVFAEPRRHCMWMKNTPLPLSVAFLDEEGRIINIADMQPHSEDNHCAARPARFALEMSQGWFRQKGLDAGTKVMGAERLAGAVR
ncbi:DUF192 domain-containing protein [Zoogloea sp.]|uniref:DUF192 domain-containing protein n=1 Tax=Zoogloea sp. TaxID=49181 RepID=UPI0026156AC8|nr:DUF192 domain-containing protein [Zoogloea sp.]MDD3354607.1 DUF192 domain-containing protein [Zoogloea sp.]